MSKWLDEKQIEEYLDLKKNETPGPRATDVLWKPDKGTKNTPNMYKFRFLPNKSRGFTKKYMYHMFRKSSGEGWIFILCSKTDDWNNFCPICAINNKLWQSESKADKDLARAMKRKNKHISNIYLVDDPRDKDNTEKVNGTVKLYEYPDKVDQKIKSQLSDDEDSRGISIFDPGENGYDFILKVGETEADGNNNTFWTYDQSEFSVKNRPLGSDSKIKEIMDSRHEIQEYINSMKRSNEDIVKILKDEDLYGWVETDLVKNCFIVLDEDEPKIETHKEDKVEEKKEEKKEKSKTNEEQSDEEILAMLNNL